MNLNANWALQIDQEVFKSLKKIPQHYAKRILSVIDTIPFNPFYGDIQKMQSEENTWRRRVGAYRIFYEVIPNGKIIYVFRVERRTSKIY